MDSVPPLTTPIARSTGLVVRQVEDELLVFDAQHERAHALGPLAALVWHCCDGATLIAQVTELVRDQLDPAADEQTVWGVLLELKERELLAESALPQDPVGMTRRDLLKKAGAVAGGVTVLTIVVPPALASASGTGCGCGPPQNGPPTCGGACVCKAHSNTATGCIGDTCAGDNDCCPTVCGQPAGCCSKSTHTCVAFPAGSSICI